MQNTKTFTVTSLNYNEVTDTLFATICSPDKAYYTIEYAFCASMQINLMSDFDISETDNIAVIAAAFATAFQKAHDEQNPEDSPASTELTTFEV